MAGHPLTFGHFVLDPGRRVLLRDGEPLSVGHRGVALLERLLRRPGEVLTKAELMDAAWPGMAVEESNLSVQMAQLRKALGQPPGGGDWIVTVPRVGYRFTARAGAAAAPPAPEGPALVVLPFVSLSCAGTSEIFADGLTEDIITTLSKLPGITVIARQSSFAYKGRPVDVAATARDLGVRYVLQGSVRASGERIRVAVQLTDAASGAHVWAERFDHELGDIFAIQDEISLRLATEMQVQLTVGLQARLRYATTSNVEAWTYWAQGQAAAWPHGGLGKEPMAVARGCWEKALALDPASAPLNAMLAFVHAQDARLGWWDDRETALTKAEGYLAAALELDPENADAHGFSALVRLTRGDHAEAVRLVRRSRRLAPGSADLALVAGFVLTSTGHAGEAAAEMERAMALNPHYPAIYLGFLGNAYRLSGRSAQAIGVLEEFAARSPRVGLRDLVIAYGRAGRCDDARRAATRLLAAQPGFTVRGWIERQFRSDTAELAADAAALRAAGLPD